jgi:hypothetical protein
MRLPPIATAYEAYADGKKIGSWGNPWLHAFVIDPQARTFALPQEGDAHRRTLAVALRVWHEPLWAGYASGGPATGGALIGNSGLINATTHLQGVERAAQAFGQEDDITVLSLTIMPVLEPAGLFSIAS